MEAGTPPLAAPVTETTPEPQPSAPAPPTTDQINDMIGNLNIKNMVEHINKNPNEVGKLIEETLPSIPQDMINKAKQMAQGGQGMEIIREMQRRGVDPHTMRTQVMQQQRLLKGLNKSTEKTQSAILITDNRQAKQRNIPCQTILGAVRNMLSSDGAVESSCSHFARGPLAGKSIKVWYNPNRGLKKNRRATKIAGFDIFGSIIILVEGEDLTLADFQAAESQLE